eukprot:1207762-Prymnesium_polylepis.1
MAQAMEPMEMTAAYDEQPTNAAPRVAAAAEPHKRRAAAPRSVWSGSGVWRPEPSSGGGAQI